MVKSKSRTAPTKADADSDRAARLRAAEQFQSGDRVLHLLTHKQGTFREVCVGFAVTEVWVDFDTDTEAGFVTAPCNPLELIKLELGKLPHSKDETVDQEDTHSILPDSTDSSVVEIQEILEQIEHENFSNLPSVQEGIRGISRDEEVLQQELLDSYASEPPSSVQGYRQDLSDGTGSSKQFGANEANSIWSNQAEGSSSGCQVGACQLNLSYSMPFQELAAFPSQPETSESKQPDSSSAILTAHRSSPTTSQESKSTMISEILTHLEQPGTSSPPDSPVPTSLPPMLTGEDCQAIAPDCGGSCSGLSPIQNPDLSASKMLRICGIEDLGTSSVVLPKSGTWDLGSVWEQPTLERPTLEKGCSWLPTPMAYSPGKGKRRPGQTKLDLRLRADGHLKKDQVLDPAVPLWMMGFPLGWLDVKTLSQDGGEQTPPPLFVELPDVSTPGDMTNSEPSETPSALELPRSPFDESSTSIASFHENVKQEFSDALLISTIGQPEHHTLLQGSDMNNFTTATAADSCVEMNLAPELNVPAPEENSLSPDEEADRKRLETRVERAFYESGTALRELCSRRLYRSTHKTFEEYAKERFGLQRAYVYQLIDAVGVVENLSANGRHENLSAIGRQNNLITNGCQVMPTTERQVRPLTKLAPSEQRQVWQEAVEQAGGKIPSGRVVKEVVERRKRENTPLPEIPYAQGDVVMIRGAGHPGLRKHDGQWAITVQINEYSVTIALPDGKDIPVKPQFLEPVDPKDWTDIKAVHERIVRLQQCDLDPVADDILESLRRRTCFTDFQFGLLDFLEMRYNIS